ncbi:ATP-binding protein [Actinoplanes sp. NPDC051851]|uniref:sensor histidine kinase n=1 Tax=Actinoplanes sp. NPDC051851 TaxID=3154753 RepID=UPI00343E9849
MLAYLLVATALGAGRSVLPAAVVALAFSPTHRYLRRVVGRLVYGLRPPALDQLGLLAALRERALHLSGGGTVAITVDDDGGIVPLPAAVEVAAYHIVSESITNVVRHAGATRCSIRVTKVCLTKAGPAMTGPAMTGPEKHDDLTVEISDDGRGLPERYRAGVGPAGIRERATELGGTAHIGACPEGGTLVSVRLPLRTATGIRPPG